MKKRAKLSLPKGVGYSTAVFFDSAVRGRSVSKNGITGGITLGIR